LVAFQREAVLGEIIDGEVKLYAAGKIVRSIWEDLPRRYPGLELDEMIVMPNHFHGILNITEDTVGAIHELPQLELPQREITRLELPQPELPQLREETPEEYRIRRRKMLLPKIIGYLKMNSARKINLLRDSTNIPVWQKNYFERLIRNDEELNRVREYIRYNPVKWEEDEEYIFR
jgi:REP element-mobilizing transposase RayT